MTRRTAAFVWAVAALFVAVAAWPALAERLHFQAVAPGVFVHAGHVEMATEENLGDIANIGFVIGGEGVAVIDTGGSMAVGRELLAAIRAETDLPILYVINTHMHPDHTLGNGAFRGTGPDGGDPVFVGHAKMARSLAGRASHYLQAGVEEIGQALVDEIEIVLPDESVDDQRRLDLGDRPLVLQAWSTAHTDNDMTVLDEATGTLFAGDLLFMSHLPVVDGSIAGWITLHDRLREIPAERVVPGHGPASAPWPESLIPQETYLKTLAKDVRQAIQSGVPMGRAVAEAAPPTGDWELVDEFHKRNVTAAFAELEWE
ncbi:MAG: quinoprotein relay system zinc metallohydrolase 2 [Pseudomonadota bacterium]